MFMVPFISLEMRTSGLCLLQDEAVITAAYAVKLQLKSLFFTPGGTNGVKRVSDPPHTRGVRLLCAKCR